MLCVRWREEIKYFSLLTVIFLSVSSPEILCLLSFHNEIHSFSFVVTKTRIYPQFCIPAVSCRGPGVTIQELGL